jgi:CBS domain containing-hemolysin-like protein
LIEKCLADKAVLFSTLLVGNTFVNFAISTIGYYLISWALPSYSWVAIPVLTLLLLLFGEITPKRFALKYTEQIAPYYARILIFWRMIFTPFNAMLRFSSKAFDRMLSQERRALSDAELISVLENAAEEGTVSKSDANMVEGVLRLSELCANDEMTPRVDIEGYDIDRDEAFRAETIKKSKHRYLPMYNRTTDNIEGILDTVTMETQDAIFVPETVTLDDLLVTFAKSSKPLAVVLDEYGGTAGIISPNDIIEIILGPSVFGDPKDEPQIMKIGANEWEIDAKVSLDEVNRELDVNLEAEDADRLSGWVQFHAERIPHVGQEIVADGCRATVLKRRRRRVTSVKLEVMRRTEEHNDWQIIADTDKSVERTEESA